MIPLIKDLIMKMRAGRLTGISAQPEALPALHLHSLHHSDGFHVRISCLITEAMVHHHLVSVAENSNFTVSTTPSPVAYTGLPGLRAKSTPVCLADRPLKGSDL